MKKLYLILFFLNIFSCTSVNVLETKNALESTNKKIDEEKNTETDEIQSIRNTELDVYDKDKGDFLVTGKITDSKTNEPLVSVKISFNLDKTTQLTKSDESGKYKIYLKKDGSYSASFESNNYHQKISILNINSKNTIFDINLDKNVILSENNTINSFTK
ncbi:MAG: carboxypeptidase-like regulatory domain-containing protein [Candidatus Sericytochromatia bacterium]